MKKSTTPAPADTATTRRQTERLAIELPITVRASGRGAALQEQTRTLDLSRGGASFTGRRAYRAGMNLRIGFVDLQHLSIGMREITAEVVRVIKLNSGKETAVATRFVDVDLANLLFSELLRVKMRTSSALLGVIQALTAGAEIGAVTEAICRTTERAMDAEKVLLFLRDPHKKVLRAPMGVGELAEETKCRLGEGLVGKAAEGEELINSPALSSDPRYKAGIEKYFDERTRSVLCVPLSKENGVSPGVLVVVNKRFTAFNREDEGLGRAVADQIGLVLREARLFEEVRSLKNYYERILESIPTGILTFDRQGRLITVNQAATRIFGFQPGADAGKDFATLFSGTANARLASLTADVLAKQRPGTAYDIRFLRGDGVNLSLNLNALPLQGTQGLSVGGVLGVCRR